MARVEKTIDVEVPVRTAYNQWTQFEDFPEFMEGVHEVNQMDATHLHWRAKIAGHEKEWDAVIREQVPDEKIIWASTEGAENAGIVQFASIGPNMTRVHLEMSYDPEGVTEHLGDALGFASRRISGDLQRFKDFIEARGVETGGYRETHANPEVPGGHTRGSKMMSGGGEPTGSSARMIPPGSDGLLHSQTERSQGGGTIIHRTPLRAEDARPGVVGAGMDFGPDDYPQEMAEAEHRASMARAHGQGAGVLGAPSEISDTDAFNRPTGSDALGTRPADTVAGRGGNMGRDVSAQQLPGFGSGDTVPENVETVAVAGEAPPVQLQTPGAMQPGSLSRELHQREGNGPGWTADASSSGQLDAEAGNMAPADPEPPGDVDFLRGRS